MVTTVLPLYIRYSTSIFTVLFFPRWCTKPYCRHELPSDGTHCCGAATVSCKFCNGMIFFLICNFSIGLNAG